MRRWRTNFTLVLAIASIAFVLSARDISSASSLDNDSQGAIDVTDSMSYESKKSRSTVPPKGKVGRKAAAKYMGVNAQPEREIASLAPNDHYLALHFGTFVSDNAYRWGLPDAQENVGRWQFGVTYRVGEWVNSMDLGIRLDLLSYSLGEGRANKLSFAPLIMFPDASSKFPLYFGAGAGPGVFINQIGNKSVLSLDYQIFGGVRFFDVVGMTGFFVEAGLKNHFLLLSDGQFNGTYVTAGTVFSF